MRCDQLALHIAGGKKLKHGSDDANQHAAFYECPAVSFVAVRKQVKRADRSHDKASSLRSAEHGVSVLPERPLVQQQSPETCQFDLAVCANVIRDRMLHPGVRGDDEITAKP